MPDIDWIVNTAIAHRGLHDDKVPENSLLAFSKAIECGYVIELDVRLSSDEEVVVFHDNDLSRITGKYETVESQTASRLKTLRLLESNEKIPVFSEVLEVASGRAPILIEIKNKLSVGSLERKLAESLRKYKGEYAVQSFNPNSLRWYHDNFPHISRGQLSCDFKSEIMPLYKKWLLRNMLMNWVSKPNFIAYDINSIPCWATSRQKDTPILAWTVDSQEKMDLAKTYADSIIFENIMPDVRF